MTVIATGFDSVAARQPVASASQTPVDLQHYSAHLQEKSEAPVMDLGRLSIARRPALDLSSQIQAQKAVPSAAIGSDPGEIDLDALSAFDVPAFLRREG